VNSTVNFGIVLVEELALLYVFNIGRVRMLESREPHLRPNRGLADGENAFYKGESILSRPLVIVFNCNFPILKEIEDYEHLVQSIN